jgi:hypothetical protein
MIQLLASAAGRKALFYGAVALTLACTHTWAYLEGRQSKADEVKVENAKLAAQVAEAYKAQVERGNLKAAEVQAQKDQSNAKLTTVLNHVHKVTTTRDCLSHDAVRLLNKPSTFGLSASPRHDVAEVPNGTATDTDEQEVSTDTDVVQWIAKAKAMYESCAANNNGIVDVLNASGK